MIAVVIFVCLLVLSYSLFWQKPAKGIRFLSASSNGLSASAFQTTSTFRVMTFNIKHAARKGGGNDIGAVADVIRQSKADIIALQEVDRHQVRSFLLDQGAWLSKELGMNAVFGPSIDRGFGQYGNMLITRFPILKARTLTLPARLEPRTAIIARVATPAGEVTIVATHLGLSFNDRSNQVATVLEELQKEPGPYILMGDWNASVDRGEMSVLAESFRPLPQHDHTFFPSRGASASIDRIFISEDIAVNSVEVLEDQPVSDHRPVIIELLGRNTL